MTQTTTTPSSPDSHAHAHHSHADELEDYGGGHIQAKHGYLPIWLLVVYFIMFVWGLWYAYHYWGGVGPGRIG